MTVRRADGANVSDVALLRYRVTLIAHGKNPATTLTDQPAVAIDPHHPKNGRAQLRVPLPSERTVVVVEALDEARAAKPVIVGVGTTLLDAVSADQKRLP
jgi:hypothetical protein